MRPKGDSLQETLKLFQEGLTPDEIARKRNLSMSTINTHLYHFVKSGEIDVFRIIDNTTFDTIKTAMDKVGSWSLSDIKTTALTL